MNHPTERNHSERNHSERSDSERSAAFWRTVKRMRAAQRDYFKRRNPETMRRAKEAEDATDRWVDALESRFGEQRTMEWSNEH